MDEVSLAYELISTLCIRIFKMAEKAQSNKERCKTLATRVNSLYSLVLAMKRQGRLTVSSVVKDCLNDLRKTLTEAEYLMQKYSKTGAFMGFLKASSHENRLRNINENITTNFEILCGAMQIEQRDIVNEIHELVRVRSHSSGTLAQLTSTASTQRTSVESSNFSALDIRPATTVATPLTLSPSYYTPSPQAMPMPMPTIPVLNPMMPMAAPGSISFVSTSTNVLSPRSRASICITSAPNYFGPTFSPLPCPSNIGFSQPLNVQFAPTSSTVISSPITYVFR